MAKAILKWSTQCIFLSGVSVNTNKDVLAKMFQERLSCQVEWNPRALEGL